jgi:TonB family protein
VPPEFRKGFGRAGCGMIVIWTRHGDPKPKKRKDEPAITATALAELVAASQVYTADQVDVAAAPTADIATMMAYPDSLRGAARVAASAVVEFVVDAAGAVEAATINFVAVPARPFIAALRGALPALRFTPAAKNGMAVRQVVQLAVHFDPSTRKE